MKTSVKLIAILLVLIYNLQSFNLYAQDPELFEHTWYLNNIVIDDIVLNSPMPEIEIKLYFNDENTTFDLLEIVIPFCSDGHSGIINFDEENIFNLDNFDWVLLGNCNGEEFADFVEFMTNHYTVFAVNDGAGIPKNPFVYTLEFIEDYSQLTITNGEGDWAIYNSVLLSTPTFHQNSFTLYPNPVKEVLQINTSSNETVKASIYDINGKLLQTHSLENNVSSIDVKALKQGIYFVVFENESGERVSKKFVKK